NRHQLFSMKLFVLYICSLIGLVCSETCTEVSGCVSTQCDEFSHVVCANGQCTCELREGRCDSKADCDAMTDWLCPPHRRHCIDNRCRCLNI
uniref:EB domain-containing protein n=2 Tax=Magallana gigas TaxID=29159 RepID=A0A8W8NPX3_MAGGI